ncbi:hypothetical protein E2C01_075593 [Portunus trituberculatus]|uniref:Uncharacterized protein n=1 Tax=Portunus trituberculatus TaxID=210409 RepID=A0A5B7IFC6_PORTR|nr:hypothetical protein [Portunus trituberculatus]
MSISVKEERYNVEVSVRKTAAASPVARLQVNGISARLSKGEMRREKGDGVAGETPPALSPSPEKPTPSVPSYQGDATTHSDDICHRNSSQVQVP